MQAGFIGLGNLGGAMVARLVDVGVSLTVWNRTAERARQTGLSVAASPAALISQAPAVLLCLADSDAVEVVLRGQQGLLAGACTGKLIIDLTTNHPAPVRLFHELCRQKGARYVEAPVAGSVVPARAGKLVAMLSGAPADLAAARPYVDHLAAVVHELGAAGQATRMKLVNNLCLGTIMAVVAEALATAEAAGISREQALEVLGTGGGKSLVLDAKRQKLLDADWSPHFSVGMIAKDLHCLQDLARELERPQHLAGVVKEQYMRLVKDGRADDDFAAVYDVFR
ncbi:MAG: NAD(P)-dependent oxidoreductase [Candidatus Krumholzibacteriia bacterium]